jgi:hypothetical protein
MDWDIVQVFTPQPITGVTINTVLLHPVMRTFILILSALALFIAMVAFMIRNNPFVSSIKNAFVITFFVSGLAYTLHADIGWTAWLSHDIKNYAGLGIDEKLSRMEGGYYNIIRMMQNYIDDDYQLYCTNEYIGLRTEYFLLPKRKREQARYIIVLADGEARYDQENRTFTRRDITISPVESVFNYAPDAYVLKKKSL